MKSKFKTMLILTPGVILLLSSAALCMAAEEPNEGFWGKDSLRPVRKRLELTDERTERIMSRLSETEPEKAKELEQLRKKDKEAFKAEIRKVMRERLGVRQQRRAMQQDKRGFGAVPQPRRKAAIRRGGQGTGRFDMEDMPGPERRQRYLKWLKGNYPGKAEKLTELRGKNPELYGRRLQRGLRRHDRIMEAGRQRPELGTALKESMELEDKRDQLLEKINSAAGEDEKKQLVGELEQVVGRRFDLLVKRRQIRYELLQKRLVKMQERVRKIQADIDKWNDPAFKDENVKKRLEELLKQSEQFKWD